jgi:ribosomal protein L16/L10AE
MIKRSIKFRANDIETYIYNYIKPIKPLTAKSKNARMGRGKGMPISKKVFQLQNSTLLFQMPNKFKFNIKYIKF